MTWIFNGLKFDGKEIRTSQILDNFMTIFIYKFLQ